MLEGGCVPPPLVPCFPQGQKRVGSVFHGLASCLLAAVLAGMGTGSSPLTSCHSSFAS
jgi:hypothetical protein